MDVKKAIEISDAKIQFVSFVDKAANLRQFLVTKGNDGNAHFSTYGKILKVDSDTHYITGIVYEPLVEDAHGNYMTEDEIRKAAYWYAENGDKVDIQHSFESAGGLSVVENYVAPCDMTIGDTPVVKGTWLLTVKCTNEEVWGAVQKGELTGFSMGGIGKYSEEETDLGELTKNTSGTPAANPKEKKSLLKALSAFLGFDVVEKGEVLDTYNESTKNSAFWNAMWALEDTLYRYNWGSDRYEFVSDEATIREALEDFNKILTTVLSDTSTPIIKAVSLPLTKAGKKMSSSNKAKLDEICQALSDFKASFDEEEEIEDGASVKKEEHTDMDKNEVTAIVEESITKALIAAGVIKKDADPAPAPAAPTAAPATTPAPAAEPATPAAPTETPSVNMEDVVAKAMKKVLMDAGIIEEEPAEPTPLSMEDIEATVAKAVAAAVAPLMTSRGLPTNLNGAPVTKAEEPHYLHGIL